VIASETRRYTLAQLEGMATIKPISTSGSKKRRMGCPFHGSDHQRSLEVNLETGRYHCYTCDAWGYLADGQNRNRSASHGRPKRHWGSPRTTGGQKIGPQNGNDITKKAEMVVPQGPSPRPKAAPAKLAPFLQAAQAHLADKASVTYLQARHIPLDLARSFGLGYFPPGEWPERYICRRVGRVGFPLYFSSGELVGIASRAVDPDYPDQKAPKEIRFDTWGSRGIFNLDALKGPALYLCESPFDALVMIAAGFPTAGALVGTKGLRWEWLGQVQELYICWDLDDEGLKAARALAQQAVVHGRRVYVPGPEAYNGYSEPSEQWEREGRVTLRICCGSPIHPPTAERCPTCRVPMCLVCKVCDPICPSEFADTHMNLVGDGLNPPLDRPPQTREELANLIAHLNDPEMFAAWWTRYHTR
jgi:hypothetical protein